MHGYQCLTVSWELPPPREDRRETQALMPTGVRFAPSLILGYPTHGDMRARFVATLDLTLSRLRLVASLSPQMPVEQRLSSWTKCI